MNRTFTIVLGLMLCNALAFAQIPNCNAPTPYPQLAYDMLKNLDKTQISTGVLYEYAFPLAELDFYDGSATTDTSSYSHFLQSYYELYNSTFNRVNIAHLSDFEKTVQNFPNNDFHHPVGIIDYNFNTLDPESVNNNLLSVSNEQLFDVPNRTQSPYNFKIAMLASPLLASADDNYFPDTHYLHFSSAFVLTNTGFNLNQVQSVELVINGTSIYLGMVAGLENAVIPFVVENIDEKMSIKIILQLSNSTKNYLFSANKVHRVEATSCSGGDVLDVYGYLYDGGYTKENGTPVGSYGAFANATIYYAQGNCETKRITKPIIFVDGFDPGNKQHAPEIWEIYLNKIFRENDTDKQLGDELRSIGKDFDIIIFDPMPIKGNIFNAGGTGLIENNGLALAKFLQTFYAQHSATMTQDFIVVGASMGGLISRFGLAWMEKEGLAHHTSLFISFDSPQAGAQIPIGLQQMVDTFTQSGILTNSESVRNALHQSPAAKQMIIGHSSSESETAIAHPYRSIFLNNLASVGNYPTQCRNIAISDGNRNGILKNILPNPNIYDVEAIDERDKELDIGIKRRLFPNCTQIVCYKLHAQVYAQTASARSKTFEFNLNSNNILLNLVGGAPIGYRNFKKYAVADNNTSIDIAPGSRLRKDPLGMINTLPFNVFKVVNLLAGKLKIDKNVLKFSNFVPTASSFDYTYPNLEPRNAYKNFQGVVLSKYAGTTPFDTVYAQSQDLDHVDIDVNVANSFRSEVYFPKAKSVCTDPDCPPYLTLNTNVPNGERLLKKAQKAIFIEEGFKADGANETVVFKAAIGCDQLLLANSSKSPKTLLTTSFTCSQPFEFDQARNFKTCNNGFTTFHVFVHNIDISTYAEFSTDGVNWFKANILDNGWEITLPNNSQSQYFQARTADDRTLNISGYLAYCN
jgi:hypothetical protein